MVIALYLSKKVIFYKDLTLLSLQVIAYLEQFKKNIIGIIRNHIVKTSALLFLVW